eukprot:c3271_g1_i1 orf=2-994(-)
MTEVWTPWFYASDGDTTSVRDYPFGWSRSSRSDCYIASSPLIIDSSSTEDRDSSTRSEGVSSILDYEEYISRRSLTERKELYSKPSVENAHEQDRDQLSILALLLAALRRSLGPCKSSKREIQMDIGWPTSVRHVIHVTFDRYNGFIGLPIELETEIPVTVPSASASVFGVSAESMQCSYDRRGNSIPTILLLIQEKLYAQGGLKTEGIFRVNAESSHKDEVREQLNKGIVPDDVDIHCLACLIKGWFRELPKGVLDSLAPERIMHCSTEEHCLELVEELPSTEGALLDWAINLMADVVQEENSNKMNAHNIAMVFAPNMTQMIDPLTALM